MAATKNAAGGKGFKGGHVGEAGKRKGMAARSNSPARSKPGDNVRELRRRLWVAAKQSPERRFHALYDRMWRDDVLREAWKRVKKRRGAAGLDAQSIADVERYGVERFLEGIAAVLRAGEYRPSAVLRRYIPKADGKKRPLGIPTVRDRVVQMAANAARHFRQIDTYVYERLRGLRVKRAGRQLSAGESAKWTRDFFHNLGLHRLRGTVKYPEAVTCR